MVLHPLIMNSSDDLAELFVLRYIFYIKIAIIIIIVLTCVLGVKVTFAQDRAFTRVFLLNGSVSGIF